MSNSYDLTNLSVTIFDTKYETVAFCKACKKRLKSYRAIRHHYFKFHSLDSDQFSKISKLGRLLGARN